MLNGLVTPDSISMRIGSGCFFFETLPALVILTDLVLSAPTSTLPKLRDLGETLSLPATGVGVVVGVAGVGTTTVNPFESLEGLYPVTPGKLAPSVVLAVLDGVISQEALPLPSVVAPQPSPPIVKLTVWPASAT